MDYWYIAQKGNNHDMDFQLGLGSVPNLKTVYTNILIRYAILKYWLLYKIKHLIDDLNAEKFICILVRIMTTLLP